MTRIELGLSADFQDSEAKGILSGARDLGVAGVDRVKVYQVYYFFGDLQEEEKTRIAESLLTDLVTQQYRIDQPFQPQKDHPCWSVEVTFNRGVTDLVAETALKGIRDLGILSVQEAKTAKRFEFFGALSAGDRELIGQKLLINKVVQHIMQPGERLFFTMQDPVFQLIVIPLRDADEEKLMRLSRERDLFLNAAEMRAIQEHFRSLQRDPTDIELEMIAQTWSEHCSHKTLTGLVEFEGQVIRNPLKQTIFRVTRELDLPWCVSVFKDNAGVIHFDDDYNICFKVETHNHPSAMEPYGGANTGIGGVIRDPLGTGLGAKPIINTDVFCFGPVDLAMKDLPKGVLHPKRVMQGVVAGVRDYGNRMGIPTSNGAIFFDDRYLGNPLVYCGNVGLLPRNLCEKTVAPGDAIIVVGGRTGRDGIHGATASSGELHTESEGTWSGAVQIGNPIVEKKLVDTLMQARDRGYYRAITDCGAGGLSSAIGELAKTTGAEVYLEKVPLKYHGLSYMEIWISEAQERMVIFVPPEHVADTLALFASEDVEATVIGRTTDDRKIRLTYSSTVVGELDMAFLHDGMPEVVRHAVYEQPVMVEIEPERPSDLTSVLHKILAAPNVCSKEWVIRQYDHEVQGGSVVKPLVGVDQQGPSDASVTRPRMDSYKAVILANGLNPKYGLIDPYWMAASAIDEAVRNVIAVGGSLERTALLDNFCWGSTDKPDRLGGLMRAMQACYDVAAVFRTPFISGKDSLNNEYKTESGDSIAIPPTLLISAISIMEDCRQAVTMDLKKAGNLLYVVGLTKAECGGSHYYEVMNASSSRVPQVDAESARRLYLALHAAMAAGLVASCHDCSEGGLAVALAEMAFSGGLGLSVSLAAVPASADVVRDDVLLFSESNSRLVVEVQPDKEAAFCAALQAIPFGLLGQVTASPQVLINGVQGERLIEENLSNLKSSWQNTLRW
ncbi:phosphoribosylformylglycinamidine synthase subunit PurL [bacterium]|nr:phosphoribosylformylglycinamidine synthase subunit PurL [bacterium]